MRSGNPGKKELINNLKTAPHPSPSPTRGGCSRCNTLVLRTNAGGGRLQTFLKPKISIFAQSCGGNRCAFPTLQLKFPFLSNFVVGTASLFPPYSSTISKPFPTPTPLANDTQSFARQSPTRGGRMASKQSYKSQNPIFTQFRAQIPHFAKFNPTHHRINPLRVWLFFKK